MSKRPHDSAFKQQRLPAWQPILTAGTVLPLFFVVGIAFMPIGIGLLYFSDEVREQTIDYTHCHETIEHENGTYTYLKLTCSEKLAEDNNADCICIIPFKLKKNFKANVFMYYGLSNFYQNHRRYAKSRDDVQLIGRLSENPSPDCVPFAKIINNTTGKKEPIAPCGAIANSLFSDNLILIRVQNSTKKEVNLLRTGIAWKSDKEIKFKNPEGDLKKAFEGFAKPKAWRKNVWELDPENPENNGFQNEDFIVWMRVAALPKFRKLYRRIDHSVDEYKHGLPRGLYELKVQYLFDVHAFDGTKRMILSTTSIIGGKNPFLGIVYIILGCLALLLGIGLLYIHMKHEKKTTGIFPIHSRRPYQI